MFKNDDQQLTEKEPTSELITQKLHDAETTPGFGAPFSPDEAELAGAFEEDALTENDVLDSTEEADNGQN